MSQTLRGADIVARSLKRLGCRRVFTLSKELDPGRMSAEMKQGVLKLRIHKAEHAKPRRIEVSG